MTRPSGSFYESFILEPSCFTNMCDTLTSSPSSFDFPSATETDAIFLFRSDSIFVILVTQGSEGSIGDDDVGCGGRTPTTTEIRKREGEMLQQEKEEMNSGAHSRYCCQET
ncbi:hypothetical protein E2542_SST30626 [Spatholobus suberectus]|nr:hypothetical protein E2542_SST30626 [Spatholobus suberectus]